MTERYWQNETVRVRVNFTDEDGAPLVAVGVAIKAKAPDGTHITADLQALPQVGAYYADVALPLPGVWFLRAECSGPTAAAVEDQIEVRASLVL